MIGGQLQGFSVIELREGPPGGPRIPDRSATREHRREVRGKITGKENDYNVSRKPGRTAAVRKLFIATLSKTENALNFSSDDRPPIPRTGPPGGGRAVTFYTNNNNITIRNDNSRFSTLLEILRDNFITSRNPPEKPRYYLSRCLSTRGDSSPIVRIIYDCRPRIRHATTTI